MLRAVGVGKVYGGEAALVNADLEVHPGTIHGLLGANGAGKSTLVRILCGIEAPDRGGVEIAGEPLSKRRAAREALDLGVAHIDQDRGLIAGLSIAENVALVLGYPKSGGLISPRQVREQAERVLAIVGLTHDVERTVGEIPIADQTLLAIARALALDARVLLLDEPTANLGAEESRWLYARLRRLAESGVACLLITHALGEALEVCDTITVLRNGKVVATTAAGKLTEGGLATMMVGREVERSARPRPRATAGEPQLALDAVVCDRLGPLSLQVAPGEILGVTGVADSGHLLVGDVLTGALPLERGAIVHRGQTYRPSTVAAARRLGIVNVPADRLADGLAVTLTSRENLFLDGAEMSRGPLGIDLRRERRTAREILARVGVQRADPEAVVATLSGGNMQKVLIAKWAATSPSVLVLTEPTVGVDVAARAEIYARIQEVREEGAAVILCSSDLEEVVEVSDRLVVLRYGRVVAEMGAEGVGVERLTGIVAGSGRVFAGATEGSA